MIADGLTLSHLKFWVEIVRDPNMAYEELAQRLGRSKKTVRRLEDDLIADGYIRVVYRREQRSRRQLSVLRVFLTRETSHLNGGIP